MLDISVAISKAEDEGLNLICINQKANIPIVKIGDYKKYLSICLN